MDQFSTLICWWFLKKLMYVIFNKNIKCIYAHRNTLKIIYPELVVAMVNFHRSQLCVRVLLCTCQFLCALSVCREDWIWMQYSPIFRSARKAVGTKKGKGPWEMTWGNRKVDGIFCKDHSVVAVCVPQRNHRINRCAPARRTRFPKYLWTRISNLICGYDIQGGIIGLCLNHCIFWSLKLFTWMLQKLVLRLNVFLLLPN